jgi:hypothetical protein
MLKIQCKTSLTQNAAPSNIFGYNIGISFVLWITQYSVLKCNQLSIYLSIYLSIHVCMYVCMYVCIYLPTYLRLYSPLLDLGRFFQFLNPIWYTVDRTPWTGISPSQGLYLHIGQHKHRINANRHPCLKWDSKPRSQCLRGRKQFMP